jgi:predicted transposase YbfD/YdcC
MKHLEPLTDPRVARTREHELLDVLVIALCCLLSGGRSFYDMERFGHAKRALLQGFLKLPGGIPSHDTFTRLFAALAPDKFLECFLAWTQSLRERLPGEIVAVDGKALRRAIEAGQNPRYVVSAWAEDNGLVLGQVAVAEKSNEITAVPPLLRALDLAGCVVTLDAMGCQKQIAKEIKEADADYVLALKGHHATAHEEVQTFLDQTVAERHQRRAPGVPVPKAAAGLQTVEHVEKDHGRLETRRYYQSGELAWFADRQDWEGLRTVGLVEARREINGKVSVERRYYLSSLPLDVAAFARAVRGHWGVENKLHWVLDVVFDEDQSRARAGHAAQNLATLRRLALNFLRRDTKKRSLRGKQLDAAWNDAYLLRLLGADTP